MALYVDKKNTVLRLRDRYSGDVHHIPVEKVTNVVAKNHGSSTPYDPE